MQGSFLMSSLNRKDHLEVIVTSLLNVSLSPAAEGLDTASRQANIPFSLHINGPTKFSLHSTLVQARNSSLVHTNNCILRDLYMTKSTPVILCNMFSLCAANLILQYSLKVFHNIVACKLQLCFYFT